MSRSRPAPARAAALLVTLTAASCSGGETSPDADGTSPPTPDAAAADATRDLDGGDTAPDDGGTSFVDCADRAEGDLEARWVAEGARSVTAGALDDAVFGDRAVRLEAGAASSGRILWEPETPLDVRSEAPGPATVQVAMRGTTDNPHGWKGRTPTVAVFDAEGRRVTLRPAAGNVGPVPADDAWHRLRVPIAEREGWRVVSASGGGLDALDRSAIARVVFDFEVWGSGFRVDLDGLDVTPTPEPCGFDCGGCSGRGRCAPSHLRCACDLGAAGPSCGTCAEGFEEGPDGGCALVDDGDHAVWPNPTSDTTGDAWLRAHHDEVEELRPRVLVLNFANESDMQEVRELTGRIVEGFEAASTPRGPEGEPGEGPQLRYQLVDHVDLRNGRAGNPPAPEGWPHENSTLFPRPGEDEPFEQGFQYEELFGEAFAERYGFEPKGGAEAPPTLCELVEDGRLHEVWMVAAHDEEDVVPAEVLDYKQRYAVGDTPVPGDFEPCAGNGCFPNEVSPCARSVRIGFINYRRGPGCYLHNMAHLLEWTNTHRVVPGFSRWFDTFAGMDLDERYDLPFRSLYGLECDETPCIGYPEPGTVELRHPGGTRLVEGWDPRCGNCHFPPNGTEHYDYGHQVAVPTSCSRFGRPAGGEGEPATTPVDRSAWADLEEVVPDCGGGFLTWWYRRMPAHGTSHRYASGEPMKSIWPYLFY